MASAEEHLARRDLHLACYEDLIALPRRHLAWEVTVLFYAVIHQIDMALALGWPDRHPVGHRLRKDDMISAGGMLAGLVANYTIFKALSEKGRYQASLVVDEADVRRARSLCEATINAIRNAVGEPGLARGQRFSLPAVPAPPEDSDPGQSLAPV